MFNEISIKDIQIDNDVKIVYGKDFELTKSILSTRFISGPTRGEVSKEREKNHELASLYRDDILVLIEDF